MKLILFTFVLILVTSCNTDSETKGYDIFIIAGQSNTHSGIGLDSTIDTPDEEIFQLGRFSIYDHLIIKATEPLQHHRIRDNQIGFALSFGKLYNKHINKGKKQILLLPCGFGGTSIVEHWNFDGFLYNDILDRVAFIMEKHPNSTIKAILWHQGESDIGNPDYANYLDNFIFQIREDLSQQVPFIVGGMVPYFVNEKKQRKLQQEIISTTPDRVKNTSYANPYKPFIIEKKDNTLDAIHYDAQGQRELGKRYYDAYKLLTAKTK
jgi:hypothetical protein